MSKQDRLNLPRSFCLGNKYFSIRFTVESYFGSGGGLAAFTILDVGLHGNI